MGGASPLSVRIREWLLPPSSQLDDAEELTPVHVLRSPLSVRFDQTRG